MMTVFSARLMKFPLIALLTVLFTAHAFAAVVEEDPNPGPEAGAERKGFFLEYLNYYDYVYSQSKKTELGDAVNIDMAVRYQHTPDTFARVRFITDPVQNRFNNKTSQFEFLGGHRLDQWYFQMDTEVLTNDGPTGGTSIGLDLDSELTQIKYSSERFDFTFFPFNFDGEVGAEFNTWDVTRIYFVEGAPTTVGGTALGTERILEKTIPGLEVGWNTEGRLARVYAGIGAASFLYPNIETFDIESAPTADRWERKEDVGYKFGATYQDPDVLRIKFQAVGHTESRRTGSLLAGAASIYGIGRVGQFVIENEWTASKAGDAPYRLTRDGAWFEDFSPFQPIWSDVFGNKHGWIGKTDFATSLRVGFKRENSTPYLSYKYQGANFIFRDRESAHRLRTGDESESHGGLSRVGFGAFFQAGQFIVNPEFEYFKAKNAVFANASDVRADRRLASFSTEDYQLSLLITYRIDENRTFQP